MILSPICNQSYNQISMYPNYISMTMMDWNLVNQSHGNKNKVNKEGGYRTQCIYLSMGRFCKDTKVLGGYYDKSFAGSWRRHNQKLCKLYEDLWGYLSRCSIRPSPWGFSGKFKWYIVFHAHCHCKKRKHIATVNEWLFLHMCCFCICCYSKKGKYIGMQLPSSWCLRNAPNQIFDCAGAGFGH